MDPEKKGLRPGPFRFKPGDAAIGNLLIGRAEVGRKIFGLVDALLKSRLPINKTIPGETRRNVASRCKKFGENDFICPEFSPVVQDRMRSRIAPREQRSDRRSCRCSRGGRRGESRRLRRKGIEMWGEALGPASGPSRVIAAERVGGH